MAIPPQLPPDDENVKPSFRRPSPPTSKYALNAAKRQARLQAKSERWQRRVDRYEARRAGPPPPVRPWRLVVTLLMMAVALVLVAVISFGPRVG